MKIKVANLKANISLSILVLKLKFLILILKVIISQLKVVLIVICLAMHKNHSKPIY